MALTALLIGSWKCETYRPVRGERGGEHVITKKRGIRKVFAKYGAWFPPDAWVEGDLENMKRLMQRKDIDVFDVYDYRERNKDGVYSLGKKDVLDKIRQFFEQENKTDFILYFTGHGDREGSWVIPVTTAVPRKQRSTEKDGSLRPRSNPEATSPQSMLVEVEVHSDPGKSPTSQEKPAPCQNEGIKHIMTPPASPEMFPSEPGEKPPVKLEYLYQRALRERPQPTKEWNDLVKYEEVVKLWDESRAGKSGRHLMMILECCHSGRWVQKVDGEFEIEQNDIDEESVSVDIRRKSEERHDICIQAACGPSESTAVSSNQLSSVFTRAFVAAQSRLDFEKFVLTLLDHLFVLNLVSIASSPRGHQFSPMHSKAAPFAGIKFFDSFDEMHLNT